MEKLKFEIEIKASKEKLWQELWSDAGYRKWTAAFSEGSYAETNWEQGSKILFLSPGGNGMFGIIEKKIPFEEMTFKHLGEIKNGIEEPKDWGEAREQYHLKEMNGVTLLTVTLDATKEFEGYFKGTFPKAMEILKKISEDDR